MAHARGSVLEGRRADAIHLLEGHGLSVRSAPGDATESFGNVLLEEELNRCHRDDQS